MMMITMTPSHQFGLGKITGYSLPSLGMTYPYQIAWRASWTWSQMAALELSVLGLFNRTLWRRPGCFYHLQGFPVLATLRTREANQVVWMGRNVGLSGTHQGCFIKPLVVPTSNYDGHSQCQNHRFCGRTNCRQSGGDGFGDMLWTLSPVCEVRCLNRVGTHSVQQVLQWPVSQFVSLFT